MRALAASVVCCLALLAPERAGATAPAAPWAKSAHVAFEGCPARHIVLKATMSRLTFAPNEAILVDIKVSNVSDTACGHSGDPLSSLGVVISSCGNVSMKIVNTRSQEVFPGPGEAPSCASPFSVRLPPHHSLTAIGAWSQQLGLHGTTQVPAGTYRIVIDRKIVFTISLIGPTVGTRPHPQGPCQSFFNLVATSQHHCPIGQVAPPMPGTTPTPTVPPTTTTTPTAHAAQAAAPMQPGKSRPSR
jgi:hypothetical protein